MTRHQRRLSADLTEQDKHIFELNWLQWGICRCYDVVIQNRQPRACFALLDQDRRDADLMFALQESRQVCDHHGVEHCILAGRHTALQGWDPPDVSLVELGLAMAIPKLPLQYRNTRDSPH
jgi:hypothetical protein